jgi:hypothetical protein
MSFLIGILLGIVGFFVSALALKLALGMLGQPAHENKYGTAVTVAGILSFSSFLLSFTPFFVGWVLYPLLWLVLVKSVYRIGFTKSVLVAMLQLAIRGGLMWALHLLFG